MADELAIEHEYETVRILRRGAEARVQLARPDHLNALDKQASHDLHAALRRVGGDDSVRAVVLTGEGRGFSSGADLRGGFDPDADGRPDLTAALRGRYAPITIELRQMPKPTLAAVNGPCAGIGVAYALACDLVVAAESAYILLAFVGVGLAPDGGASTLVAARVGATRTAELSMLGEKLPAADAVRWGLINRAVPDDRFAAEVDALAERLATGPTRSYAAIRAQINNACYAQLVDQLDLEARLQGELGRSEDFMAGVAGFLDKRKPDFHGR